jgi:pSer/pThr/pTyr-binding forkhead associated (FHA) protein
LNFFKPSPIKGLKAGRSSEILDKKMIEASPFALRVTDPIGKRLHRLSKGRTIVGRHPAADVKIEEIGAARQHCALDWDDHLACHLLDVWGVNGVSMNGTLLRQGAEPRPLSAGDEICIEDTSLRYEEANEDVKPLGD